MKLAEAFARRTYGGKGLPRDVLTSEGRKKINDTFLRATEEQMVMHMYELWADMRQDPDPQLMSQEHRDDFSAYLEDMVREEAYVDIIETWLDLRKSDVEKKVVQMTKGRFG